MNNAKELLQKIDAIEVIAFELLAKTVAWIAPIVTAILIISALTDEPLNYHMGVAVLLGFTIEGLGLAFMSTMVFFFCEWRGRLPANFAFWVSALCVVGYVTVTFPIVTIIKALPQYEWIVPAGGVLLSMLSGVIVGVRSNWTKHQIVNAKAKVHRKATIGGKSAPNAARGRKTQHEKMQDRVAKAKQLHADGSDVASICDELGIKDARTVRGYLQTASTNGANQ